MFHYCISPCEPRPKRFGIPKMKLDFQNNDWESKSFGRKNVSNTRFFIQSLLDSIMFPKHKRSDTQPKCLLLHR